MDGKDRGRAARRGRDKQPVAPGDQPPQPNAPADMRVALRLSMETLELLGKLLAEVPYKISQPIIADLSAQIDAHQKKEVFNAL